MNSLVGSRWYQTLLLLMWFFSLLFLYAYMDSRLTKQKRDTTLLISHLQNQRHRQESGAVADGAMTSYNEEDLLIVYNRVPKTGSTSFINVAYDLCRKNRFNVVHVNVSKNSHTMTLTDQARFIRNVTNWHQRKPGIYHAHFAFIDFTKFGARNPIFINLVRDPLDRFMSYYYFLRYGDDYRPHLVRRKHGDTQTFDDCVASQGKDCDPNGMWMQIPFFCGHDAACWEPGNRLALEQAKRNLIQHYLLVGVTDQMDDFITLMEVIFPRFFQGAFDHFKNSGKSHLRKTNKRIPPSEETVKRIKHSTVWQMEQEFYEFAQRQFYFVRDRQMKNNPIDKQEFRFEKVRPDRMRIRRAKEG